MKREYKEVSVNKVCPNPWNPNEEEDNKFNVLGESIKETEGLVEPLTVFKIDDKTREKHSDYLKDYSEAEYMIISGEHRWRASKLLDVEKKIPVLVVEGFEEDLQKFLTVKMNVIRGELNPIKLSDMIEGLSEKYEKDVMKTMLGFTNESVFDNVFDSVKKSVPEDMKKDLEEAGKEMETVDDLANVLNSLFNKYGNTLKWNFMFFTYGGKSHAMIKCRQNLWKEVNEFLNNCAEKEKNSSDELLKTLLRRKK